jgi:hypothetical protein
MLDRPWLPPGRHWPDRPEVLAGIDELAGGTWMGVNDYGVVAAILNRRGSLGPAEGFRSRGELPLEVLDHADARDAAEALSDINPDGYLPFNLVIADNSDAYWLRMATAEWGAHAELKPIPEGLSMITAGDRNDQTSPRVRTYLPQFEKADPPDPETGDWSAWQSLLASKIYDPHEGVEGAMSIATDSGFGTSSSSLVAMPSVERMAAGDPVKPVYLFAAGRPLEARYEKV